MTKPVLCIDFDGVIHDYKFGWQDGAIYGRATSGFFRWAAMAINHFRLVIYSSRSKTEEGRTAMREWIGTQSVYAVHNGELPQDYDFGRLFPYLEFAAEKPPAFLTIDDRAIRFDGDWSVLGPAVLLTFKPWNNKPLLPGEGKLTGEDK